LYKFLSSSCEPHIRKESNRQRQKKEREVYNKRKKQNFPGAEAGALAAIK